MNALLPNPAPVFTAHAGIDHPARACRCGTPLSGDDTAGLEQAWATHLAGVLEHAGLTVLATPPPQARAHVAFPDRTVTDHLGWRNGTISAEPDDLVRPGVPYVGDYEVTYSTAAGMGARYSPQSAIQYAAGLVGAAKRAHHLSANPE